MRAPANPKEAGLEWAPEYVKKNNWTSYNGPLPASITDVYALKDTLPEGTPTARHQYLGEVHDTKRDQYQTFRIGNWVYDLAADSYKVRQIFDSKGKYVAGYPSVPGMLTVVVALRFGPVCLPAIAI